MTKNEDIIERALLIVTKATTHERQKPFFQNHFKEVKPFKCGIGDYHPLVVVYSTAFNHSCISYLVFIEE